MGSFADSLNRNIERVKCEVDSKITTFAQNVFRRVISYSPAQPEARFAKGEFINSWYVAVDAYDTSSVTGQYDYYGMGSLTRISSITNSKAFYGKDGFISMSNNLPYATQVEYTGWQVTAPYAPVRISVNYMANLQGAK